MFYAWLGGATLGFALASVLYADDIAFTVSMMIVACMCACLARDGGRP